MDEKTEAYLKSLLKKSPGELTGTEKAFLKARRSYIGKRSTKKFAEVLK